MSLRLSTALALVPLCLGVLAAPATAGVPDPSRSSCTFPTDPLPCPDAVSVSVILRDAFDAPVANCSTQVTIAVSSGMLDPEQLLVVPGSTDALGFVELVFPDGILGEATVTLVVVAMCSGNIQICESQPYEVACSGPTPVDPGTWGRVKAQYR